MAMSLNLPRDSLESARTVLRELLLIFFIFMFEQVICRFEIISIPLQNDWTILVIKSF